MRRASSWGTDRAKALERSPTACRQRALPSSWARTCSWAAGSRLRRCCGVPVVHSDQFEAVEEAAADVVLLQHDRHRLVLVQRGLPLPTAFGVDGEGALEFVGQAEVVDHEAAGLVLEDAVDAGDGLHEPVAAHRLVNVHGVQARRVEAGEPHVAHQHDAQRVARVAESVGQRLAAGLVADVLLPVRRVGGGAGHHDLHAPRLVAVGAPVGTQPRELAVEVDADPAAHADDHGLAVEGFEALLEVSDDVLGDLPDALLCADDRLQLRPLRLQLLLALDFLALGGLFELRVDLRLLTLVEGRAWRGGSRSRSAPSRCPRPSAGCRRC